MKKKGGKAPCCDKSKVKRGPWSPCEDLKLISFIQKHGHPNWRALPKQAGLLRCGKSCRLRWINYLRPDVKRGNFSPEEELVIINLHNSLGNRWSKIASQLPGRTDNEIKNVWNTHLKKRISTAIVNNMEEEEGPSLTASTGDSSPSPSLSSSSCISYAGSADHHLVATSNSVDVDHQLQQLQQQQQQRDADDQPLPTNTIVAWSSSSVLLSTSTNRHHSIIADDQQDRQEDEIFDIPPLDSDTIDFWSMFVDDLPHHPSADHRINESNYSNNDNHNNNNNNNNASQQMKMKKSSPVGVGEEDHVGEGGVAAAAEYKQWLRFLESELGLVQDTFDYSDPPPVPLNHHHHHPQDP